jgi:hypothetical protein
VLAAVNVNVEDAETLDGLRVTPVGKPEEVRAILPAKPPEGVTVSALVPVEPARTDALVADMLKFGTAAAVTVRLKGAV